MKISCWADMDITNENFDEVQLIVFTGVSGSGKTITMQKLISCHPDYQHTPRTLITGYPVKWSRIFPSTRMVVIDELVSLKDYWHLIRLLCHGHNVIAASHLANMQLQLLALIWRTRVFHVDKDYRTISRFLQQEQIQHSDDAVRDFCTALGSSYVDTKIILEQYPSCSFDEAWSRFKRTSYIKREHEGLAWLVRFFVGD